MPKLTENFDQLKMSSEIRSSDHSPSGGHPFKLNFFNPKSGDTIGTIFELFILIRPNIIIPSQIQ